MIYSKTLVESTWSREETDSIGSHLRNTVSLCLFPTSDLYLYLSNLRLVDEQKKWNKFFNWMLWKAQNLKEYQYCDIDMKYNGVYEFIK